MAELRDIIAYLLRDYPRPSDLANSRVTKMVYLADWRSALTRGQQVSAITWFFDSFGPYVSDVRDCVSANDAILREEPALNLYGKPKTVFKLIDRGYDAAGRLAEQEREILDHVRRTTESLSYEKFIRLVYSTYPVMTTDKYETLDLVALAKQRDAGTP